MPLLQAIGITSVNTSFTAAVVFMPGEQEPDYEWALGALQRLLGDSFPRVVLTDRDQALMGALGTVLPHSVHLLCRWHIMMNVQMHAKMNIKGNQWAAI